MKKRLTAVLMALCALLPTQAEEGQGILLTTQGGETIGVRFASQPKLKVTATELVLESAVLNASYPLSGLRLTLGHVKEIETAVEDLKAADVRFNLSAQQVQVEGLQAGTLVQVFSINGTKVASTQADAQGRATLDLGAQRQGIYVINAGKTTLKITKK